MSNKAYREKNKDKIKAAQKAHYEKNKDKIQAAQKAYYEKNKDKCKATQKAYTDKNKDKSKAYREKNWDRIKETKACDTFNLTHEEYQVLHKINNCECCGKEVKGKDKCIDHNHDTDKVRGILCQNCNLGIGKFNDNIELIQKAIIYLENWENK